VKYIIFLKENKCRDIESITIYNSITALQAMQIQGGIEKEAVADVDLSAIKFPRNNYKPKNERTAWASVCKRFSLHKISSKLSINSASCFCLSFKKS